MQKHIFIRSTKLALLLLKEQFKEPTAILWTIISPSLLFILSTMQTTLKKILTLITWRAAHGFTVTLLQALASSDSHFTLSVDERADSSAPSYIPAHQK